MTQYWAAFIASLMRLQIKSRTCRVNLFALPETIEMKCVISQEPRSSKKRSHRTRVYVAFYLMRTSGCWEKPKLGLRDGGANNRTSLRKDHAGGIGKEVVTVSNLRTCSTIPRKFDALESLCPRPFFSPKNGLQASYL